jgi:hypothetical protein
MKKVLLVIVLCAYSFAVNKATKPYIHSNPAKISELNKNLDSIYVPFDKAVDTMNLGIPRTVTVYKPIKSGDTLIDTMKATKAVIDTVYFRAGKAKKLNADTVSADTTYSRATKTKKLNADTVSADTTYSRASKTKKISADTVIVVDTAFLKATKAYYLNLTGLGGTYGYLYGNVAAVLDTLYSRATRTTALNVAGTANASNVLTNYIQFGSTANTQLNTYIDTTFKDSLFDGATFRAFTASARIVQCGAQITLYQPTLTGTITTETITYIHGIPPKFFVADLYIPIIIYNSGNYAYGGISTETNPPQIFIPGEGYLSAGTAGILHTVITWIK